MDIHPAATIFPMMSHDAFEKLKQDIADHGQNDAVVIYDGRLLDGRNRWKACEKLGIDCMTSEIDTEQVKDPVAWVISANLHRRQLKTSQKAMCAAKLAGLPRGTNRFTKVDVPNGTSTLDDAASLFQVGRMSVVRALEVLRRGSTALIAACEEGTISVALAAKLVEAFSDKKEQTRLVKGGRQAIKDAVGSETHKTYPITKLDVNDVAAVELWLERQDQRPVFERFKTLWEASDNVGRAAIRAFVMELP